MSPAGRDQQFCCQHNNADDTNFEKSLVFGARAQTRRVGWIWALAWSYLDGRI